MYADLALENAASKDVLARKLERRTPSAKRQVIDVLVEAHQLPIRRACQIVRLSRAAYYRPPVSRARRDAPVVATLMASWRNMDAGDSGNVTTDCGCRATRGITSGSIACTAPYG